MNVKRYVGEDISECMAQVREELGVDAFILNQRTIRRKGVMGIFQKRMIEVVAAYEPKEEKKQPKPARPSRPAPRYVLSQESRFWPPAFPEPEENAFPSWEERPSSPAYTPPYSAGGASSAGGISSAGDSAPVPDTISPQEAHAAAMSVLERIAAKNTEGPLRVQAERRPPREERPLQQEYPPQEERSLREEPLLNVEERSVNGEDQAAPAKGKPPAKKKPAARGASAKKPPSAGDDAVEKELSKTQANGAIPSAPSTISAYSPHQLRRPTAVSATAVRHDAGDSAREKLAVEAIAQKQGPEPAAPAPADGDDEGFRPMILPLVREDPEPEREIHDIANLENKLDALSTTLGTLVNKMQISKDVARGNYPTAVEELLLSLIENDVHEEFAHKLAREATEIIHRQNADARDVMEQLIRQTVGEPSPLKMRRFQRTVVMLVGPTGVGKTTTLAKLAAIYQLNHHAKVGVITTDTFRIAAVQQLRTYAEILEVPLSVVYAPADIADALRDHEDKDVVLIDTAGKSPNDSTLEAEITELIKSSDCDEVHLVLSATTGFTGLLNIINTYSFLRDYKVLFTKLDETPSWGMMLNTKFLTDKAISYIAAGQTVPDDIEVMIPKKIVDRLLGR